MTSPTPPRPRASGRSPHSKRAAASSVVADVALILVFAAIGRDAHQRGEIVTGVLATAWPFLAGAAASWVVLRAWRAPLALWPTGVGVWLGTVAVGMLLRALTGQAVVLPFVVVALLALGVLLLGYRILASAVDRLRARRRRA
jgi:peptidoglycan/LPS O-acetylase OafA/YrhL